MIKKLALLCVFALSACGWHFANNEVVPEALRTLHFQSADEHSDASRILRRQLQLNDINLVAKSPNVATLRLISTSSSSRVASVFKQAREAEKILTVTMTAAVDVPNKGEYPLEVAVNRTFFDDSRAALAKSAEREVTIRDMYEQASRQLLIKMAGLHQALSQ